MVKKRIDFTVAGRFRAVIDGRWKLIWTPGHSEKEYELYDIETDPDETEDLFDRGRREAAKLMGLLEKWSDTSYEPREMSKEDEELLRSLGYIQ